MKISVCEAEVKSPAPIQSPVNVGRFQPKVLAGMTLSITAQRIALKEKVLVWNKRKVFQMTLL